MSIYYYNKELSFTSLRANVPCAMCTVHISPVHISGQMKELVISQYQ